MCCPGELAVKAWSLKNDKLVPVVANSAPIRLSLEAIAGSEWVLSWWDLEEKAAGRTRGDLWPMSKTAWPDISGCNNWFNGPVPGRAAGRTDDRSNREHHDDVPRGNHGSRTAFPGQLEGVKKFGFMAGMLALTYETRWSPRRHVVRRSETRKVRVKGTDCS